MTVLTPYKRDEFAYATLVDYQDFVTSRGQTATTSTADDSLIVTLLMTASRFIEQQTQKTFHPRGGTKLFDTPSSRELRLGTYLLELLAVTSGEGSDIPTTEFRLKPYNEAPYTSLLLNASSSYTWGMSQTEGDVAAVSVEALWGSHPGYTDRSWVSATTLSGILSDSATSVPLTSEAMFTAGQLARIGDELLLIQDTSTGAATAIRGALGSTAASHSSGTAVKIYQPFANLSTACLLLALSLYHNRFGKSLSSSETLTGAGVVITPRDVPALTNSFIQLHRELL